MKDNFESFIKEIYQTDKNKLENFNYNIQLNKINQRIEKKLFKYRDYFYKLVYGFSAVFATVVISFFLYSDKNSVNNNINPNIMQLSNIEMLQDIELYQNIEIINDLDYYLEQINKEESS